MMLGRLKLFKIPRKTYPFLCSLSVLYVYSTCVAGLVDHIPRIPCAGDQCAI